MMASFLGCFVVRSREESVLGAAPQRAKPLTSHPISVANFFGETGKGNSVLGKKTPEREESTIHRIRLSIDERNELPTS